MPLRLLALLLIALTAAALLGCGSASDRTTDSQASHARKAQAKARAQARAAHLRAAARRQARIHARRQAQRAALRRQQARQRQAESEAAAARLAEEEAAASEAASSECDPNYSGACLDPTASDYDCEGGSGDGPYYTGTLTVTGDDHYGLDSDSDGIGCEAE